MLPAPIIIKSNDTAKNEITIMPGEIFSLSERSFIGFTFSKSAEILLIILSSI